MIRKDQYVEMIDMATGKSLEGYIYEVCQGEVRVTITFPESLCGIIKRASILPMPIGHMGLVVTKVY